MLVPVSSKPKTTRAWWTSAWTPLNSLAVRDWDEGQVNDRKDHIEPVVDVLETNGGDHEPDMR